MKKSKLYLTSIEKEHPDMLYEELYAYVRKMIDDGKLSPVKSARTNGRKPALPLVFWKYEEEKNYDSVYNELDFDMHPLINTEYYRKHPDRYEEDVALVRLLSDYLKYDSSLLSVKETMNERSFEIFRREKFFQKEGGGKFCERLGIDRSKLNYYDTSEPLSYYSHSKEFPQNIIIIENKDTFYDMRRYLRNTGADILGVKFNTIVYGAGKGIWNSFFDYAAGAEEYFKAGNELLYFGDIDYEGIIIYEHLVKKRWKYTSREDIDIKPFVTAYECMLDKAEKIGFHNMLCTKEKQNTNIENIFMDYFSDDRKRQLLELLREGRYIPQEILNEHDWSWG